VKISDFKTKAWQNADKAKKYSKATGSTTDLSYLLAERYLDVLGQYAPAGGKVLDMGCGTGVISLALADRGYQVTAVDVSKEMLEQLEQSIGDRSIELSQGDIFALPVPDGAFDAIISRWVLPHFPQWPLAVIEAAKKLKPSGALLFDICSAENVELAWQSGDIPPSFGYSFGKEAKARAFYAHVSPAELELVAESAGLELKLVQPLGFFRQNAVIASGLGEQGYAEFKLELERQFATEQVREFVRWFETVVTPNLPLTMATEAVVVMRKPAKRSTADAISSGLKAWVKRWV
jgi:ubiquinone/menaquinone biosynthesis C-methylase UbiE